MEKFFNFLSIWIIILPLSQGIIYKFKLNTNGKIFLIIIFCDSICQLVKGLSPQNSYIIFLYNLDIFCQFSLISYFLYQFLNTNFQKRLFFFLLGLSVLFGITRIYANDIFTYFYSQCITLNGIIYLINITIIFGLSINDEDFKIIERKDIFYFILGLFMYSSTTSLTFSLWNYIENKNSEIFNILWLINDFFNIIFYFLISLSLYHSNKLYVRDNFK